MRLNVEVVVRDQMLLNTFTPISRPPPPPRRRRRRRSGQTLWQQRQQPSVDVVISNEKLFSPRSASSSFSAVVPLFQTVSNGNQKILKVI